MKKIIPIIVASMFALASCFPASKTSGISSVPNIKNKFGEESERVLVLPIWQNYPAAVGDFTPFVLLFDKPLFLKVKDIPALPNKLPLKTSVAIVSPGAAIGKVIFIFGAIIISETGKIVTLYCPSDSMHPMASCSVHHETCLNVELKEQLIHLFKEQKGEFAFVEHPVLKSITNFPYHDQPFEVTNNSKDRFSIVEFLNRINIKCTPNT